ncbi:hypothetical protein NKI48_18395 [Mesorhizobium sp. M0644]|uniref:hypothetical protein n=1 Tax=unclassified Mesorhizobium TaxID=325217 RepID=UPI0012EC25AA|nr:hypothetical protein [Mesorhizobium sp. LSJC280B00]
MAKTTSKAPSAKGSDPGDADQISAAEPACSGPWVEIYARRELQYQKLLRRAKLAPRLVIKLDRRTSPPADF